MLASTLVLVAGLLFQAIALQGQELVWAWAMGGGGNEQANSVAVDSGGNVYITGLFQGTADFDPGDDVFNLTSAGLFDAFVLKLDSEGNFVWARMIGGGSDDFASSVAVDSSGNVYIAGSFRGTADFDPGDNVFNLTPGGPAGTFVLKLDSQGNFVWARAMGGTFNDTASSVAVDSSANVYIAGSFQGTADFDPGGGVFNLTPAGFDDVFVVKLDSAGNFVWARAVGGEGGDFAKTVAVDSSANVYIAGDFRSGTRTSIRETTSST